jgi:hypothetical protein
LFGAIKPEIAAVEKQSGSKLPHPIRSNLQDKVYHKLRESQGKVAGKLLERAREITSRRA